MIKRLASRVVVARLRKYVRQLLASRDLMIITVTGTVGKTSTKVAIGTLLEAAGKKVGYSEDSYNTETGVPLAIFGLKSPDRNTSPAAWRKIFADIKLSLADYPYDVLVIEIAEDERAMMTPWVELLKPTLCVLTGVSPAHMERFASVEQLRDDAVALASLADTVLYNADFELVRSVMERKKQTHGFGLQHGFVRAERVTRTPAGYLTFDLVLDRKKLPIKTRLIAQHGLSAVLAAATVGRELGLSDKVITRGLQAIESPVGRMRRLPAVNDAVLLDDSYNSSPAAVKAALDTLQQLPARSRVAVLGSMNELGDFSADLHREIGRYAAKSQLDMLVTVGKVAGQYLAPAAIEAGMDKPKVKIFRTPYEAGHYLKKHVQANDYILVKGSQNGVFTEETSRILLAPGHHPGRELVRQSKAWKRKKKKSFGI
ncbi:MAG: UDP-N-acetylmuramoyl-tripeptide--D-alanyl-D-alanine ligase [Candidatus Saccharibacteria bacterium]|jgi:UDP-N-acetylmuramoyl-tripeptide--D-alanyl-D-alanine ligase